MPRTTALRRSTRARILRCGGRRPTSPGRRTAPVGEPTASSTLACRHGAAVGRLDRTQGLPAGSGNHDVGPGHRRARGPRPAARVRRRGGTLVDTAAGYGDGATPSSSAASSATSSPATRSCSPRRPASRGVRGAVTNVSRGHLLRTLDASLSRLGVDHVDLWQVHIWTDDTPLEETLSALDLAVTSGGRRTSGLELLRLADRAGRDLAARRARPGRAGLHPGGVLPAQPQRRGRGACRPRRRWASVCSPGRRWAGGADREVPLGHAVGLQGRVLALLGFVGAYLGERSRQVVEAVARARTASAGPRSRSLVWVRDRPGVTAPIVGARTAAQLRGALGVEELSPAPEIVEALDDVSGVT